MTGEAVTREGVESESLWFGGGKGLGAWYGANLL